MITNSKTFFRIFLSLVFLIALVSLTPKSVEAGCRCINSGSCDAGESDIPNIDCRPYDGDYSQGKACCKDDPVEPTPVPGDPTPVDGGHYITFTCDRCAADRRCQTPNIGVNPRYSTGSAAGACAQVDKCYNPGDSNCVVVSLCSASCSGPAPTSPPANPTTPPAATKTPTPKPPATSTPKPPTATPIPLLQCLRVAVIKNGVEVPAPYSLVKYGDRVTFRGFANATGRTATSMTFSHSILPLTPNGLARGTQTTVPATKVGNVWQADYNYLMGEGGKHVVKVVSIQ